MIGMFSTNGQPGTRESASQMQTGSALTGEQMRFMMQRENAFDEHLVGER